ncbi:MAG: Lrp/AsnC ligand binding domain-containing protein, partial [Bacteroidia bacterium]
DLQIDNVDKKIISFLMKDAMMPYTEIAHRILMSSGTIHVRMNNLQKKGIVKGTTLVLDYTKIGYDLVTFIGIYLDDASLYDKAIKRLEKVPEVVEAHYITGGYSIFIKLVCRNTKHLQDILNEKIQTIEGIQRTETFISLKESIKRHVVLEEEE